MILGKVGSRETDAAGVQPGLCVHLKGGHGTESGSVCRTSSVRIHNVTGLLPPGLVHKFSTCPNLLHTHTHTLSLSLAYTLPHINTLIHLHTHSHSHSFAHTRTLIVNHMHTQSLTLTHMQTHTRTHTHARPDLVRSLRATGSQPDSVEWCLQGGPIPATRRP